MKIETKNIKELSYAEFVDIENIECGDIILIKEKDSDLWSAQFVTLVTDMGVYLHPDSDGLDGGGIICWPESTKADAHTSYGDKFVHIQTKKE